MGKIFIGNPYNVDSEYEDDDLTFIVDDEGPIEFESSVDSNDVIETTDSETTDDEDFFFGSSNDSEWMDDDSYVSPTDVEDQMDDCQLIGAHFVVPVGLAESFSNSKPSTDAENNSTDTDPPIKEPPAE